jgi:hypothetical protein
MWARVLSSRCAWCRECCCHATFGVAVAVIMPCVVLWSWLPCHVGVVGAVIAPRMVLHSRSQSLRCVGVMAAVVTPHVGRSHRSCAVCGVMVVVAAVASRGCCGCSCCTTWVLWLPSLHCVCCAACGVMGAIIALCGCHSCHLCTVCGVVVAVFVLRVVMWSRLLHRVGVVVAIFAPHVVTQSRSPSLCRVW